LAATINILVFALVFTISCSSGDKGPDGRDADHCVVNDDWDIICTTAAGKVTNEGHLNGGEGDQGPQGDRGDQGAGCKLGDRVDNSYQVLCGPAGSEEVKGILDGCAISFKGDYEVNISCGNTSLGLCTGVPFDPDSSYCLNGSLEDFSPDDYEMCGETNPVEYNVKTHYCGFAPGDERIGVTDPTHVLKRCNDADNQPNQNSLPDPNDGKWEYCRYINEKTPVVDKEYCDDGNPINKDSWQEQYCGYPDRSAIKKKVQKGICDNPGIAIIGFASDPATLAAPGQVKDGSNFITVPNVWGPNQIAFGQGYCEVRFENRATGKTTYSERICGTNGRPNEKKWQKQYCGYDKETDKIPTKVFSDMCSDGTRPSAKGDFVQTASSDNTTLYYSIASNRAYKFDSGSDKLNSVPGGLSLDGNNAPGWNGPYNTAAESGRKYFCGYLNAKGETQLPGVVGTTLLPACPTVKGNKTTYKTYNTSKWNGDYCGYKVGIRAGTTGTETENEFGGLGGKGTTAIKTAAGKSLTVPNFLKNAKSKTISDNPDTLYLGSGKQGACDDRRGPFMYKYASQGEASNSNSGLEVGEAWNGYCKASSKGGTYLATASIGNTGYFCDGAIIPKNGYCGKVYNSKKTGADKRDTKLYTSGVCGDLKGPFYDIFGGATATKNTAGYFCGMASAGAKATTTLPKCGDGKNYNEGTWKGEYCGFVNRNTTGGPNNPAESTSPSSSSSQKVYKGLCTYDWRGNYDYISASAGTSPNTFGDRGYCQGIASQGTYNQGVTTGLTQLVPYLPTSATQANGVTLGLYDPETEFPTSCPVSGTAKKLNEGSWKGEYCVGSANAMPGYSTEQQPIKKPGTYKVITCQGILVPENVWDIDTKCKRADFD